MSTGQTILILGARGRLAAALAREWGGSHRVEALTRSDVDVSDEAALRRCLESRAFDVLVNGTGLTNVDACEKLREEALAVNAAAPGIMARVASARGARLIHFSTDYVFDGRSPAPLVETDPACPLGWYGETKRRGEQAVLEAGSGHVVMRVSWIFGPDRPGFVEQVIRTAMAGDPVSAVADKFSCPTSAVESARWFAPFLGRSAPGGLYHACNSGGCSWQEYGEWALQCASEAGFPVRSVAVAPILLRDMKCFTAARPVHTILSTEKLIRTTGITPRPWRDALREHICHAPIPPAT